MNQINLPEDACEHLRKALLDSGIDASEASDSEIKELGFFLLNLTAAAIKTREKCRLMGNELPPSEMNPEQSPPIQSSLPGL